MEIAPDVTFLMSLFLNPSVSPEVVREAAGTGVIYGVKLYPAGVTTNSNDGVLDIEQYYPVFKAMVSRHEIQTYVLPSQIRLFSFEIEDVISGWISRSASTLRKV